MAKMTDTKCPHCGKTATKGPYEEIRANIARLQKTRVTMIAGRVEIVHKANHENNEDTAERVSWLIERDRKYCAEKQRQLDWLDKANDLVETSKLRS